MITNQNLNNFFLKKATSTLISSILFSSSVPTQEYGLPKKVSRWWKWISISNINRHTTFCLPLLKPLVGFLLMSTCSLLIYHPLHILCRCSDTRYISRLFPYIEKIYIYIVWVGILIVLVFTLSSCTKPWQVSLPLLNLNKCRPRIYSQKHCWQCMS